MGELQTMATWLPATAAMLEDSPGLRAILEFEMSGEKARPLGFRERATGRRRFVASNGVVITTFVTWRWPLARLARMLDDLRHPLRLRTRRLTLFERLTGWAERDDE